MKHRLLLVLILLIPVWVYAQDIEVKKLELLAKDQTAVTSPRKDINGTLCGLVKVLVKEKDLSFQGNIIGEVEGTGTEYYVYLAKGCKRINLKHPNYLPKTIVFSDYGITRIESGITYLLELKVEKAKHKDVSKKQGLLVLSVKPSDAQLYFDDELITKDVDGIYTLNLPQGRHYYSVKQGSFSINNRIANIGSKATKIDVDLTEYYAYVNISCAIDNMEIYIDNILRGTGKWSGIIPPGEVKIETKLKGYSPQSRTMTLNENDSISINFSDYQLLSGSLSVNYKPDSCDVYVDGKKVGITPLTINKIAIGEHRLLIEKPYYSSESKFFTIEEGQSTNISGNLSYKNAFSEIWVKAHEGDQEAQFKLACCYLDDSYTCYTEGWDRKNKDASKAIQWLEKSAKQGFLSAMRRIALCYFNGTGCKRDFEQSFYWAKKCVEIEMNEDVCYLLGNHYRYGVGGVTKDIEKAAYWFRQAILSSSTGDSRSEKALKEIGFESYVIK